MSNDQQVTVAFGARTEGLEQGAQRASASVKGAGNAMRLTAEQARELDDKLSNLMARMDGTYAATRRAAEGASLLDENLRAGNISARTHAEMMDRLSGSMGKTAESAGGVRMATAGVTRELVVLGHEAMTGSWSRMPGTMIVLASRTGNLGSIFAALRSPVGLVGVALAATAGVMAILISHANKTEAALNQIEAAFTATGRAGVINRDNVLQVIDSLSMLPGVGHAAAAAIVQGFAEARHIGGDNLIELSNIVGDYAYATGQKVPDAAKRLAKALEDPAHGAKELDAQLNILSGSQLMAIERFEQVGDHASAQRVILEALRERVQGLSGDMTSAANDANAFGNAWDRMLESLSRTGPVDKAKQKLIELMNIMAAKTGDPGAIARALNDELRRVDIQIAERQAMLQANQTAEDRKIIEQQLNELLSQRMSILHTLNQNTQQAKGSGAQTVQGQHSGWERGALTPGATPDDAVKAALNQKGEAGVYERQQTILAQIKVTEAGIAAEKSKGAQADQDVLKTLQSRLDAEKAALSNVHGKGDMGRVAAMREELEEMKDQEQNWFSFSKAREVEFWQTKLATVRKGSKDYAAIHHELAQAQKAAAKDAFDTEITQLQELAEAARRSGQSRVDIEKQILAKTAALHGQGSPEANRASKGVTAAEADDVDRARRIADLKTDAERKYQDTVINMERETLAYRRSIGEISADEQFTRLRELLDREYALNQKALDDKLVQARKNAEEEQKLLNQRLELQAKYAADVQRLNHQAAEAEARDWKNAMQPMEQAFDGMLNGVMQGTQTWEQVWRRAVLNVAASYAAALIKMGIQWTAFEIAQKAGWETLKDAIGDPTKSGIGAVLGKVLGGGAAGKAADKATQSGQDGVEAANTSAVSANTASMDVLIPSIDDLAAAVDDNAISLDELTFSVDDLAAAIDANTAALEEDSVGGLGDEGGFIGKLWPFATGAWEIGQDMPAYVHAGEMIVPADAAEKIRNMHAVGGWAVPNVLNTAMDASTVATNITTNSSTVNAGGSMRGGDTVVNLHVSAVDGHSVERFFRNNRGVLAKQIRTSVRDHELRMPK